MNFLYVGARIVEFRAQKAYDSVSAVFVRTFTQTFELNEKRAGVYENASLNGHTKKGSGKVEKKI